MYDLTELVDYREEYFRNRSEQKRKDCERARRSRLNDPDLSRRTNLKRNYGITVEDYNVILINQNGVCAICGMQETALGNTGKIRKLAVDHCHLTGKIRGLLCCNCNRGIGYLKESKELLLRAANYIGK